ncbi:SLC14A1 [Symbiodinium microadriaticum]|nr:SLC14A1 [Symbiodinium microadriaticum]
MAVTSDPQAIGRGSSGEEVESQGSASSGEDIKHRWCSSCPWWCCKSATDESGAESASASLMPEFVVDGLSGVSQVCFVKNSASALLFLVAILLGTPRAALVLSIFGCLSSTGVAACLGLDRDARKEGMLGYNGVLVGCSFSVFIENFLLSLLLTIFCAGISAVVFVGISRILKAQLTLAFNLVSLVTLCCVHVWIEQHGGSHPGGHGKGVFTWRSDFSMLAGMNLPLATLNGVAQMFFVTSVYSGVLITLGIYLASPFSALASLLGSCVGALWGVGCGGRDSEILDGFFGYNAALIALWISLRYRSQSYRLVILLVSCGASAATAVYVGLRVLAAMSGGYFPAALTVPLVSVALCFVAIEELSAMAKSLQSRECTDTNLEP